MILPCPLNNIWEQFLWADGAGEEGDDGLMQRVFGLISSATCYPPSHHLHTNHQSPLYYNHDIISPQHTSSHISHSSHPHLSPSSPHPPYTLYHNYYSLNHTGTTTTPHLPLPSPSLSPSIPLFTSPYQTRITLNGGDDVGVAYEIEPRCVAGWGWHKTHA